MSYQPPRYWGVDYLVALACHDLHLSWLQLDCFFCFVLPKSVRIYTERVIFFLFSDLFAAAVSLICGFGNGLRTFPPLWEVLRTVHATW